MFAASWYVLRRRDHWDVVIASSHFIFDVVPLLLARNCVGRAIYWHHPVTRLGRPAWTYALVRVTEEALARLLVRRQVHILTGNTETRDWLERRGLAANSITITPNGPSFQVPTGADAAAPNSEPRLRELDGRKFVLFCARLSKVKGAGDLAAISHNVLGTDQETTIVICGAEGAEAKFVRADLESYRETGAVVFLGFVSETTKKWLFEHAHVLIAPSYEEGWGLTVADGVASGCWVVAYDLPAVRESSPVGPIFVPLGDVESFSRATANCLSRERAPHVASGTAPSWKRIAADDLHAILDPPQG